MTERPPNGRPAGGATRAPVAPSSYRAAGRRFLRRALTGWTKRTLAVLTALATLVGLTTGVIQLWQIRPSQSGKCPVSGELDVGVARFGQFDSQGKVARSRSGDELAAAVAAGLSSGLEPITAELQVTICPPSVVGDLRESGERQSAAAARLAERRRLKILVYGAIHSGTDGAELAPAFFVDPAAVPGAEELAGEYQLGASIPALGELVGNPVARKKWREAVTARTQALAWLIVGLGELASGEPAAAMRAFLRADGVEGWQENDGKEIIYVLLGNAQGRSGRYREAIGSYTTALRLNPDYARAQAGLGDAVLHRFQGDCDRKTDLDGLARAEAAFISARTASDRPRHSDLDLKVLLGLARTHACRSQTGSRDEWATAEREYRSVIEAYENGNQRARPFAADAWAGLALVYLPVPGAPDATVRYQRAADAYSKALDLTRDQVQEARLTAALGYVEFRLGDINQATNLYRRAAQLDPNLGPTYLAELRRLLAGN